jgi:hypothetical protein
MSEFHVVTVGWSRTLIDELWAAIEARSAASFSHIAHPRHMADDWQDGNLRRDLHFFRETSRPLLPPADPRLLESLEQEDVPTVHNMILGDRVVHRLEYGDALQYATFLARRLFELFGKLQPSVVVGGFDSLHGGLALAVAKRMGIPWFALHFSVIPQGLACFCDRMSPAARVTVSSRSGADLRSLAETSLRKFEARDLKAHAYIAPSRSLGRAAAKIPARLGALARTLQRSRDRDFARFMEVETRYDVNAALRQLWHSNRAHAAISGAGAVAAPPATPYVLFGLHMQPESSIDVWAPYFSNQKWVIETLSRSIPPTHRLLVKIHKSDVSNYSSAVLARMRSFPGVQLVHPSADSRTFIERADLVVAIQGTMGLEAALLGRPVILLGDSPVTAFPGAVRAGALDDLPGLVRQSIARRAPHRDEIIEAYADYLVPFLPASHNDWRVKKSAGEIENFVGLFEALRNHLAGRPQKSIRTAP